MSCSGTSSVITSSMHNSEVVTFPSAVCVPEISCPPYTSVFAYGIVSNSTKSKLKQLVHLERLVQPFFGRFPH